MMNWNWYTFLILIHIFILTYIFFSHSRSSASCVQCTYARIVIKRQKRCKKKEKDGILKGRIDHVDPCWILMLVNGNIGLIIGSCVS
jgi:hypothetical protein